MFDNIKRLKKLNKEIEISEFDEDASSEEICIKIDETSCALSPFCGSEPIIGSELSDYLENCSRRFPLQKDIHIKIEGEGDKALIEKAIRNYYKNKLSDSKREFKKNTSLAIIFTLLAIVVLTAAVLMNVFVDGHLVLQEIVDIVGWVFMWEAVDIYFLQRGTLRINQIRYLNFIRAKVE